MHEASVRSVVLPALDSPADNSSNSTPSVVGTEKSHTSHHTSPGQGHAIPPPRETEEQLHQQVTVTHQLQHQSTTTTLGQTSSVLLNTNSGALADDEEEKKHDDESSHIMSGAVTTTAASSAFFESVSVALSDASPPVPQPTPPQAAMPTYRLQNQSPKDYLKRHVSAIAASELGALAAPAVAAGKKQGSSTAAATTAAAVPTATATATATAPTQPTKKKAGTSWWERVVVQRSSYVVEDLVEQYTSDSYFLSSYPESGKIAFLDRIELETGDLLGSGTYSNVYKINTLQLLPDYLTDHQQQDVLRNALVRNGRDFCSACHSDDENQNPAAASSHHVHNKGGNSTHNRHYHSETTKTTGYAIKHLKSELLQNSKLFEAAAADLIMEAKYLARLDHENILQLRGMALGGTSTFAATGLFDSYFIVVDELQETLINRIHRWKVQGSTDQYQPAMILHKLKLAVQVASALAYLHERRLVFRDLKPHNIGIKKKKLTPQQLQQNRKMASTPIPTHTGATSQNPFRSYSKSYDDGDEANGADADVIQLFDFGFCRELPAPPQGHPTMIGTVPSSPRKKKTAAAAPSTPTNENDDNEEDDVDLVDVDINSPKAKNADVANTNIDNKEEDDDEIGDDEVYCMSGKGTLLYMASEVLSSRCYNQKADVYRYVSVQI